MSFVSISEAARLTGKGRSTIQRHMKQGKLSHILDDTGKPNIDISELLRVYGAFADTGNNTDKTEEISLKIRLATLEAENNALKDHIGSLKQAMLLIEHKLIEHPTPIEKKKWWIFWK